MFKIVTLLALALVALSFGCEVCFVYLRKGNAYDERIAKNEAEIRSILKEAFSKSLRRGNPSWSDWLIGEAVEGAGLYIDALVPKLWAGDCDDHVCDTVECLVFNATVEALPISLISPSSVGPLVLDAMNCKAPTAWAGDAAKLKPGDCKKLETEIYERGRHSRLQAPGGLALTEAPLA